MKGYIVPIYEAKGDSFSCVGTGFFVTSTLFATAAHVLRDGGKYLRLDNDYIEFNLSFRKYEPYEGPDSDDLAICRLPTGYTYPVVATLAKEMPAMRAPCIIAGFKKDGATTSSVQGYEFKCEFVHDVAMRSPHRMRLQGSATLLGNGVLRGISGGPITNEAGEVIGMLTGGSPYNGPTRADTQRDLIIWAINYTHISDIILSNI
jgi:V8-like Glu-specific endopeptidase